MSKAARDGTPPARAGEPESGTHFARPGDPASGTHFARAIVGTAGHIDHGKSELVRALTGIDTDRLPEEKARGISIELGFAHLDLEGVGRVGIVDVPGHERFIRQMLAGAHGFDLVLVVVAADDGVMPQTEEHFDIVHLLGVRRAIFVVTKCDAATPARVEEVAGEIEILAAGTPFETAPVVAVSARSGEGLDRLREVVAHALADLEPRSTDGPLRIPVDRVFVLKGHGIVATGTALAGTVRAGDEVVLLPDSGPAPEVKASRASRTARVREVQVHGEAVAAATAGQRVALNLAGIDKDDVARGDTVAAAGVQATRRLDARVEVRPAARRPLASHVRVRVHHGTRESLARLVWLDGVSEVAPRESAYAQLVLEDALVAMPGDRFVIRDETASRTLGGGIVLLPGAPRHRRALGDVAPALGALEVGDDAARLRAVLELSPAFGMPVEDAAAATGIEAAAVATLASGADSGIRVLGDADGAAIVLAAGRLERYASSLVAETTRWQAANPNLPGVDIEHLRGAARPVLDAKVFRLVVERLARDGRLVRAGNLVRTRDHAASLGRADEALAARMMKEISAGGTMPPAVADLAASLQADAARVRKIAAVLVLRGEAVRVSADLYFSREAVEGIRERLEAHLRQHGEITPAAFRDLIAASRKYGIPLLDWFDREGLTIRVGDLRKLRQS